MKTNKSFAKRIQVTKTGKLLTRTPGGNHFNAKESREKQLDRKGKKPFDITKKKQHRFLPNA